MKYVIEGLPYKPNSIVYFMNEGKIGIGVVHAVQIMVGLVDDELRDDAIYIVKDWFNVSTELKLRDTQIAYDVSEFVNRLDQNYEEAQKEMKEDICG